MIAYRNPGLNLLHLAASDDEDRTICKHYPLFKMEQVDTVPGDMPVCTDCYMTFRRKELENA